MFRYNLGMAKKSEVNLVQNPALLAVGCRQDVLVWRQQSGTFRAFDAPDRVVRVGTPGIADAGMIVSVTITPEMVGRTIGVAVQSEFKTTSKGSKQSADQKSWQAAVKARGGIYRLVRSAEEMEALVEDVKAGRWD